LVGCRREKAKNGEETWGKTAPCQHNKIGGEVKRKKRKRKQQGCDIAVEQAVSTARKFYRVIEPVVSVFTNRPKKTK
jgi:hypothetical protein